MMMSEEKTGHEDIIMTSINADNPLTSTSRNHREPLLTVSPVDGSTVDIDGHHMDPEAAITISEEPPFAAEHIPENESVESLDPKRLNNIYATKKTVASGLLDLALISANANQLRNCLSQGPEAISYYHFQISMIGISICLQAAVALVFLAIGRKDADEENKKTPINEKEVRTLRNLNDWATGLVVLITVVNVFIAAFGESHKPLTIDSDTPTQAST